MAVFKLEKSSSSVPGMFWLTMLARELALCVSTEKIEKFASLKYMVAK